MHAEDVYSLLLCIKTCHVAVFVSAAADAVAVAAVAAADPAAAVVVFVVFVAADAGDVSAAPAAVAHDVLAVTVCSYCIVCAVDALIADAAMYGILLLLCLLLQFGVAMCCDSRLLYVLALPAEDAA